MSETVWNDIKTVPMNVKLDVYVWDVDGEGAGDGFRWTDVKIIGHQPQVLSFWDAEWEDWREHDLSQNGQFVSHWAYVPEPPRHPTEGR